VNGQPLSKPAGAAFEFEVTPLLQLRNELVIDVAGPSGLYGEVALEVRCTAYLRDVAVTARSGTDGVRLHAAGWVVGKAERPLELYLLFAGTTTAYGSVTATPDGTAFQLASDPVAAGRLAPDDAVRPARVELVNGAVVWYGVDVLVARPSVFREGESCRS
jgi:hypothetical protein